MLEELQLAFAKAAFFDTLIAIVGAIILLIIGLILGRVVGKIVRLVLDKIGVDAMVSKAGVGDTIEKTGWSISKFFDVVVRWFIYIIFIMAAVDVLNIQFMADFMNALALYFPRLIIAAIILIVGMILITFATKWIDETLGTRKILLADIIAPVLKAIMVIIVLVLAMEQLLINMQIIYTFLVPLAWGIGIGVGVAIGISVGWGGRETVGEYMHEKLEEEKKEK
jgi:small-conductance mechanosensitive channel